MSVDRGGLDYKITTAYDSASLKAFLADIESARSSISALKTDIASVQKTAAVSDLEKASLKLSKAQAAGNDPELLNVLAKTRVQLRANTEAIKARAAALTEQNVSIGNSIKSFFGLSSSVDGAEKAGGRALFTFRRLIGIFAVFTAARATIRGFFGLVGDAIEFNSQLETTALGIAALTTAVGTVKSATGEAVSASVAFSLAQQEARRQTQLLRQEAVAAAVSFSAAVNAFQVGIAPGLRAGLNLDQVRQFAVQIAQAAKTLELADNQLAEEIRSILAGTIQARTTRIATALGITNEDIKRAKELGTLSDLLNVKFRAFNSLSEAIGQTFEGAMARVKSAAEIAIQQSSVGFFGELKGLLNDVLALLTDGAAQVGKFQPSPEAVAAFKILFDSLQSVVAQLRIALTSLGGVSGFVRVISNILEVAGASIIGVLQAVFDLIKTVSDIIRLATSLVGGFSSALASSLPSLASIVSQFVRIVAELYLIVKITTSVRLVFLAVVPVVTALVTGLRAAAVAMGLVRTRAIAAAVATEAAAAAASPLKAVATGAAIIGAVVLFDKALNKIIDGTEKVQAKVEDFGKSVLDAFDFKPQVELAAESLQKFDEEMQKLRDETRKLSIESSTVSFDKAFDASHFELQGKVLEQAKLNLQRLVALDQASQAKDREAKALAEGLNAAKQQELTAQQRLTDLGRQAGLTQQQTITAFEEIKQLYDDKIHAEERIKQLQLEEVVRQQKLAADLGDPLLNAARVKQLSDEKKAAIELEIRGNKENLSLIEGLLLAKALGVSADQKSAVAFIKTVGEAIDARGRQVVIENTLAGLGHARRQEEEAINEQFNIRAALIAQEAATQLAAIARVSNARTADNRAQLDARKAFASAAVQEEIAARGVLEILRAQQALERKNREVEAAAVEKQVRSAEDQLKILQDELDALQQRQSSTGGVPEADITAALSRERNARLVLIQLQGQQNALLIDQARLEQDAAIAAEDAAFKLDVAHIKASRDAKDIGEQIKLSLTLLNQQLPTQFEIIFNTLKSTISSFASFASSAITDAFDPTKTVDLKDRFGRFLQGIAQQILQTLFQIAATKAALGLVSLFGFSSGGEVPAFGRARGGPVPGRRRAQGFAGGGRTPYTPYHGRRPPGLDSRDTVPIWARPGEWFVAPERSKMLGNDFMHQLAFGDVNPNALRAAVGLLGAPVVAAPAVASGPGFAAGGFVSPPSNRSSSLPSSASSGASSPLPAYIVGGPQSVERFLRSGSEAAIAFFEEQGFRRR